MSLWLLQYKIYIMIWCTSKLYVYTSWKINLHATRFLPSKRVLSCQSSLSRGFPQGRKKAQSFLSAAQEALPTVRFETIFWEVRKGEERMLQYFFRHVFFCFNCLFTCHAFVINREGGISNTYVSTYITQCNKYIYIYIHTHVYIDRYVCTIYTTIMIYFLFPSLQLHGCKPDSVGIKAQSQQMARDRGEDMGRGVRLEENFQPL